MHWAYKIAEELIEKYPNKEMYVCASGISPSGTVHIGNFREVVTTYFVVQALQRLGKKTRFILSWDDYDRFRKVPQNIDVSFEQYVGMPYSKIPDPFGCHATYAEHFEKECEVTLEQFGIEVEYIYQSEEYQKGRYNQYILETLKRRKEIYDIVMKFKTAERNEQDRDAFYPISLYCEQCKKDTTTIHMFDEVAEWLQYNCNCGHGGKLFIMESQNIKLSWKVDWPMRWMVEDVVFEPGGRDHSSETGSYNVSKEIAQEIFGYEAPHYAAYDFISIKGDNQKMSSSSGNIITPSELLQIYSPEMILFLFAKYKPNASFQIGLDEDVIRNYTEYERYYEAYKNGVLQDESIYHSIRLASAHTETELLPKFNHVASILPLVNFHVSELEGVLHQLGETYKKEAVATVSNRVRYWIENWHPEKALRVNEKKHVAYYETLQDIEKEWVKQLCNVIRNNSQLSNEEMLREIYAICHLEDKKEMKKNQKRLFTIVYKLVLNNQSGPRLPVLLKVVGTDKMLSLLEFE
ncbi:lysyl-tRNA synthetase [Bacillus manliponensis]|uniref:Lysine--tRNA ligase n=1 Tax=Bacillus manliponensis TaxID=574376 RepID=A0A073JXC3_9BACI|nr:lysine--tRNA ligase [Bacillus manliponensis]KEK19669.1 lysyl-tRNA synthetase [Bacillus manliponensis]